MSRVSHSEVESYLLCKRKHWYGYGLSLKANGISQALSTGTAGHAILDTFYATILAGGAHRRDQKKAFDTALSAARAKYAELVSAGFSDDDPKRNSLEFILFEWYFPNEALVMEGWTILATEQEFVLEYDNSNPEDPLQYPFVVDLIALDPNGRTVVVDHKFLFEFMSYEETELQPQIPKYIGALRALKHKIDYGAYNQLRTRRIVGTKSKAAPNGAGPTKEQMLDFLPIKPNSVRVQTVFLEQIGVSSEIQQRKNLPFELAEATSYRTANKMVCRSCDFKALCTIELTGGNAELMKKTEYQVRERKVFSEEASPDAE